MTKAKRTSGVGAGKKSEKAEQYSLRGCVFETRKIADLIPAAWNPRTIDKHRLDGLSASIDRFGLVQPIVWNRRSGNVVGGHQRLKVLRSRGVAETTVAVVDLDDAGERALNVTLNNPNVEGEFDDGLQEILRGLQEFDPLQFLDLNLGDLMDKIPDDVDWAAELGDDSDGAEPSAMQRSFVLSIAQCEVLDEALALAKDMDLDEDPDNSNATGNALAAICGGFIAWARQSRSS